MKSATIEFNQNSRRVFTGVKHALETCGEFHHIKINEETFRIHASKGLPIFGEFIECKIVATGTNSSKVVIESSDKVFYNIFKWGNNKRNVNDISDYIRNEVYSYLSNKELGISEDYKSGVRIVKPDIRFRD